MTDKPKTKLLMPPDWDEAEDGEWDDEYASPEFIAEAADTRLIVEHLNKHLDPEQEALYHKRFEEDEKFRALAGELAFIWSIPTHLERHPRPAGELERDWDEFSKRVGIGKYRPKPKKSYRRLWLLGLALLALSAVGELLSAPLVEWYVTWRDYRVVPPAPGWIPLGDSVFTEIAPGAKLRAAKELIREERHVILTGAARFLVLTRDSLTTDPRSRGLVVRTRGGLVLAGESEFRVTADRDTTLVEVQRPSRRRYNYFIPIATHIRVQRDTVSEPVRIIERGRARLVRGQAPERLPSTKDP